MHEIYNHLQRQSTHKNKNTTNKILNKISKLQIWLPGPKEYTPKENNGKYSKGQ